MPAVYLRPAGVYDDLCSNTFLAHQIARIFERRLKGHLYPGDLDTGQTYLHLDDLVAAIERVVARRGTLPLETPLLLGEPDVLSYGELQREIGRLIHGSEWDTWKIPKALTRTGAWVEDEVLSDTPFTKPWMIDSADDHYALDISQARELLDWEPRNRLRPTLEKMIVSLKEDPVAWCRANKLDVGHLDARAVSDRQ